MSLESQFQEVMVGLKAQTFALKLQNAVVNSEDSEEEQEAAMEAALKKLGEEVQPQFKVTATDFASNFVLWKKDVGEEVANDLKDNPQITEIVDRWVHERKEHNTEVLIAGLLGMLPEDERAEVERIDVLAFIQEYMGK